MKITLYAALSGDTLWALSSPCAIDTTDNGWLFPEIMQKDFSFADNILKAESRSDGLFITPLSIGSTLIITDNCTLDITILPAENTSSYRYRNLPIGGGGYVTGFVFDEEGTLFCRTDIGGCYRSKPPHNTWQALSHNADIYTEWLCNPLAIACCDGLFYALFGNHQGAFLGISENKGESFNFYPVPAHIHGNCAGRSTGERIAVTSRKIFIGTRGQGLLYADRLQKTLSWKKATLPDLEGTPILRFCGHGKPPAEISPVDDITFVHALSDDVIIVGTAADCGVLVSCNGGESFAPLPCQPCRNKDDKSYISQRCAVSEDNLFITYSCSYADRNSMWFSYACDGSMLFDGAILHYRLNKTGSFSFVADITPPVENCGFSGIDVSSDGEFLVCTNVCTYPSMVFLSSDMGKSWKEILSDPNCAVQDFKTPYLKPENNNDRSPIHWTSDIKINPHNRNFACINTGTGVFCTRSLGCETVVWEDFCSGVEETVHLGIYSPPKGKVRVIDVVGDLGGFSFTDIDKECDFTFRDENKNRYVTAINADFAEKRPEIAVCSPRGNWIDTSKGGAALSLDGGINWKQLRNPEGMSPKADMLLEKIACPNVNPGWVAVSAEGNFIIRQIADGRYLPADCIAHTDNFGESWTQVRFFDSADKDITVSMLCVKIFSDRINNNLFYAFGIGGEVFISRNGGLTFRQKNISGQLPCADFSSIEGHDAPDIRISPFETGTALLSFADSGLFRLKLEDDLFIAERVIPESDCSCALCAGFGKGQLIFFCGIYKGVYGFYRLTENKCIRINTDSQQFGQIRSICGDPRAFGRFYIATGSFGAVYGEIDI